MVCVRLSRVESSDQTRLNRYCVYKDIRLEPQGYHATYELRYEDIWKAAMRREAEGLVNTNTHNHLGEVKGTAGLVAEGSMQKEGVDYLNTCSPVFVPPSIGTAAVAAVQSDWTLIHWDTVQAFVRSKILIETSCCESLTGIESNLVVKLNHSFYGLRHLRRVFKRLLVPSLLGHGSLEKFATDRVSSGCTKVVRGHQ